jgi:polyphosphate kinase
VQVRLVIRGICGLRPGIPGISDRIRVVSIVGRFLEHQRILQFGPDTLFVGSPDLMPRNLDRRVEILVPVRDPDLRAQLRDIIDIMLADNSSAWRLGPGGTWSRVRPGHAEPRRDSQEQLMARAQQALASAAVT